MEATLPSAGPADAAVGRERAKALRGLQRRRGSGVRRGRRRELGAVRVAGLEEIAKSKVIFFYSDCEVFLS